MEERRSVDKLALLEKSLVLYLGVLGTPSTLFYPNQPILPNIDIRIKHILWVERWVDARKRCRVVPGVGCSLYVEEDG